MQDHPLEELKDMRHDFRPENSHTRMAILISLVIGVIALIVIMAATVIFPATTIPSPSPVAAVATHADHAFDVEPMPDKPRVNPPNGGGNPANTAVLPPR